MMGRCFFIIGTFFIILLGFFCIWNCAQRQQPKTDVAWNGCKDEDGKNVDMFILYKLPEDRNSQHVWIRQGLSYMYLTPDTPESLKQSGGVSSVLSYADSASGWILSNRSIAERGSMPGLTLGPIYASTKSKEDSLYLLYNDEFPNGTVSSTYGHTKGVVYMTRNGGFWLIHSTPKYPAPPCAKPVPEKKPNAFRCELPEDVELMRDGLMRGMHTFPLSGTKFGQTFLCISLPPGEADNLGGQLLQNHPHIFDSHVGPRVRGQFPALEKIIAGAKPTSGPWFRVAPLTTKQGTILTSFAKFTKFGKDLYSALVAPTLKTSLLVESWRNGPHPLPSACNNVTYRVENIEHLSVRVSGSSFPTHKDHSKWAVSSNSSAPFVCLGDINRMASQGHRAGGTVCVHSQTIWNRFYKLVTSIEACPRGGHEDFPWLPPQNDATKIMQRTSWKDRL